MKVSDSHLHTPLYLKLTPDMPWPAHEQTFYLLSRDGLFLCRNHPFFRSTTPMKLGPGELAPHAASLELNYPRIPQRLFEKIIGFFARVGLRDGAEVVVLMAWNRNTNAMEVIVPEQTSLVSSGSKPYPLEVHYVQPTLPPHLMLISTIHSHVCEAAFVSYTDELDQAKRPGLHVIVGRLDLEPPDFCVEITLDRRRFKISDLSQVIEGYERRRLHEVPRAWEEKVKVMTWSDYQRERKGGYCESSRAAWHDNGWNR